MAGERQKFRVGGSGYTRFQFNGQTLMYLEIVRDTAPRPVAAPQAIQPLAFRNPVEIAFPNAVGAGTLELTIREQWASPIWEELPGMRGAFDILEVFERNINNGAITVTKSVPIPGGGTRFTYYLGCVVTDLDESETVEIGTMTLPKRIVLTYIKKSRTATA